MALGKFGALVAVLFLCLGGGTLLHQGFPVLSPASKAR